MATGHQSNLSISTGNNNRLVANDRIWVNGEQIDLIAQTQNALCYSMETMS